MTAAIRLKTEAKGCKRRDNWLVISRGLRTAKFHLWRFKHSWEFGRVRRNVVHFLVLKISPHPPQPKWNYVTLGKTSLFSEANCQISYKGLQQPGKSWRRWKFQTNFNLYCFRQLNSVISHFFTCVHRSISDIPAKNVERIQKNGGDTLKSMLNSPFYSVFPIELQVVLGLWQQRSPNFLLHSRGLWVFLLWSLQIMTFATSLWSHD